MSKQATNNNDHGGQPMSKPSKPRMSTEQITAHLRKVHGIDDGVIFDPYLHDDVPALCFGEIPVDADFDGPGQHLRPEFDAVSAAMARSAKAAQ